MIGELPVRILDPGDTADGQSLRLPCGHVAVLAPELPVWAAPPTLIDHLDACPGVEAAVDPGSGPG